MKTILAAMSMFKQILLPSLLAITLGLVVAGAPAGPQSVPSVGEVFQPAVGQGTNKVTARLVEWTEFHGLKCRIYVFFASPSRQLIKAPATNQVCCLNGRLFSVSVNVQSFYVNASLPTDQNDLTLVLARDFALRQWNPAAKVIDMTALLKSELAQHLAQPLVLQSVTARTEGQTIEVDFVSQTGLRGKVILDENLEVLSMSLLGAGGGR